MALFSRNKKAPSESGGALGWVRYLTDQRARISAAQAAGFGSVRLAVGKFTARHLSRVTTQGKAFGRANRHEKATKSGH
jgi:hypothetical protein